MYNCEIAAGPNVLAWCLCLPLRFRDNQYVSSRNSSGKIEFHHVRLEHAGQYQCKMTNPQGGFVMSDAVSLTVGMYACLTSGPSVYTYFLTFGQVIDTLHCVLRLCPILHLCITQCVYPPPIKG